MAFIRVLLLSFLIGYVYTRDCYYMEERIRRPIQRRLGENSYRSNRGDWSEDLEILLNYQINNEMKAFYALLYSSQFFHREDHYLEGFTKYFHTAAMEKLKHAEMFMAYQNKRGGRVQLLNLHADHRELSGSHIAYKVFKHGLFIEKEITNEVLCFRQIAEEKYHDTDLLNFLDSDIISGQFEKMQEYTHRMKSIARMSSGKFHDDWKNYGFAEAMYDGMLKNEL